jgi:CPA2 family monovalent cation:H+ antiporter-2
MMQGIGAGLAICVGVALLARKFSFPAIPCYILAGLIAGRSGLSIVLPDPGTELLTRLGLLFLLFSMGLALTPARIRSSGSVFAGSGAIDLAVNLPLGIGASLLLGFGFAEALLLGSALYITSSAMALASLIENRRLALRESETVVWLMIFEDLVLVVIIAILATSGGGAAITLALMAGVIAAFFIACHILKKPLQRLLSRDDDLPLVFTFAVVPVAAVIADILAIPETLTAIGAGAALAMTQPRDLERLAKPFRDVFIVVFFFFFGAGIELAAGLPLAAVAILAAVAVGSKLISGLLIGTAIHRSPSAGLEIWSHTTARGEFSIALAAISGSAMVSGTVAPVVIVTAFAGAVLGKNAAAIRRRFAARNVP